MASRLETTRSLECQPPTPSRSQQWLLKEEAKSWHQERWCTDRQSSMPRTWVKSNASGHSKFHVKMLAASLPPTGLPSEIKSNRKAATLYVTNSRKKTQRSSEMFYPICDCNHRSSVVGLLKGITLSNTLRSLIVYNVNHMCMNLVWWKVDVLVHNIHKNQLLFCYFTSFIISLTISLQIKETWQLKHVH